MSVIGALVEFNRWIIVWIKICKDEKENVKRNCNSRNKAIPTLYSSFS